VTERKGHTPQKTGEEKERSWRFHEWPGEKGRGWKRPIITLVWGGENGLFASKRDGRGAAE